MGTVAEHDVVQALGEVRSGSPGAEDRLARLVYEDFRRMAVGLMRRERPGHTLQATALVHEAMLRLLRDDLLARISDHRHLFGSAARVMREVLVDHARRRTMGKRGGAALRLPLDAVLDCFEREDLDVVGLHEALDGLAAIHERPARVVTLRFFGGSSMPEIAEELEVSLSTVESDFRVARAWLRREMAGDRAR